MDFSKMTIIELREYAKTNGIKGVTALRKQELVQRLTAETAAKEEKAKETKAETTYKPSAAPRRTRPAAPRAGAQSQQRTGASPQNTGTASQNAGPVQQKTLTGQRRTSSPRYKDSSKPEGGWPRRNSRVNSHSSEHYNSEQREQRTDNYRQNDYYRQGEYTHPNEYSRPNEHIRQGGTSHQNEHAHTNEERVAQNNSYQSAGTYYNNYNQQKLRYHDGTDGLVSIVKDRQVADVHPTELKDLDSGITKKGILEIMQEGYGFVRCDNFLPGENDVYVAPQFIRRFGLRTGDVIEGNLRTRTMNEKFSALLYMKKVNGRSPSYLYTREKFEDLTPIFPNNRIHLETPDAGVSMRMLDLISPIGKGQRGMIVSQPKTGKTTLLKQVAKAVTHNYPKMHLLILLIDERPEEVTDIKESIEGENVEVIYSTFDELPDNHKRVSEMVIERAKRLVEGGDDVMILLDSITRLARAYNLTVTPSGRTLSGGLDPAALHMPKRFFGAARNMREGGSLTILATALVDTGSRMDDVVFEEFKGTGNMELVLDRSLSEKRIFPAIDIQKSSTRREDLLLNVSEQEAVYKIRKALNGMKSEQALEQILNLFKRTKNNTEFIETVKKMHL